MGNLKPVHRLSPTFHTVWFVYATAGGKDRIARKRLKTCRITCRKINVAQDAVDNEFCDWMLGGLRCWLATQGFQPLDRTSVCRLMRSRMPAADGCTGPPVCSSHNIRMDHFKGGGSGGSRLRQCTWDDERKAQAVGLPFHVRKRRTIPRESLNICNHFPTPFEH